MTDYPPPILDAPLPNVAPNSLAYATLAPYSADTEHLRLLSIFHFIVGPVQLLFGLFPVIHLVMGILMLNGKFGTPGGPNQPDMSFMGWMFIAMASVFILIGMGFGILTLISGFQIQARRRRTFSVVVAAVNCIHFPFGTTLGVFTLIVLLRRSVEELYRSTART
ncbi:MAG: signal peptide protein [Phycisphaerales bacterium]|nr:signal peptide protein [Phycisphaerales bacterium]